MPSWWVCRRCPTSNRAPRPPAWDTTSSTPPCGSSLPAGQAFGIVGVNGGTAATPNPCLADQLTWAATSSRADAGQDGVQLYVNTANPGEVIDQVTTWPTSGSNAYGTCTGSNSAACSFEYGQQRAAYAVGVFTSAAASTSASPYPGSHVWWLDVKTTNTWQTTDPSRYENNRATLEGMSDHFTTLGARVGIYSTALQWGQIVGTVPSGSTLSPLDSWLAGARTLNGAKGNCASPSLTGGRVAVAQYVSRGLDRDHACP